MKITLLGTAAAEGWPGMYCNCDNCKRARVAGGRNIRTRSQTLINHDLLIDYPADTYAHVIANDLDLSAVRNCLITHSHLDHFMPPELLFHNDNAFAHDMKEKYLDIYGNERVTDVYQRSLAIYPEENPNTGITMHILKAYETVQIGKYKVTPLPAEHAPGENAFVYLIREGESTLLYLLDTDTPDDEVVEWLHENKVRADLIVYDCTMGVLDSCPVHMGYEAVVALKKRFEVLGISDGDTISVINHFSHNGVRTYDEMLPVAEKDGIMTAYDGMIIEI